MDSIWDKVESAKAQEQSNGQIYYLAQEKKEENDMSGDSRHCPDCGGSDGWHYNDGIYDGTDGPGGYSSGSRGSSGGSGGKVWLFYIFALIIGYAVNELLGVILLIGMVFWLIICK